ncbi:MAG: hypothetical protein LBU37_00355, partial [Tannerellaceae bacterium]|jgi:hypothetical protein|nr:hypothetical protein [Tannerellaceae bacterium]
MNEGNMVMFERPFFSSDPRSDTITLNFMKHHRFIFQPNEYVRVALPSGQQIKNQTGLWDSDFSTSFEIRILITKWATESINLQGVDGGNLIDWKGGTPSDNNNTGHNYGNIDLSKGDSVTLYYYNTCWYITNLMR